MVFENRVFHGELNDTNPYKGPPTPELDAAWHKLLAPTAIRASADDMKKVGRTSIELKDGSGFFVTLGEVNLIMLGITDTYRLSQMSIISCTVW